jgi:hypothetical protein
MQLTFAKSSLVIAVGTWLIASPAAAQEPAQDFARWVPSLWLGMGVLAQRGYGEVMLVPLVGLGAELMTPSLAEPAGRPRIFISGGVRFAPKVERSLAREGNPGSMLIPDPVPDAYDAQFIANQGSDVSAYIEPWVWRAGLGVAFTVPVRERRLQIKPSVEYYQERVKIEGTVTNATDKPEPIPPTRRPDEVFELTELGASTTETFRGLGPRLALELDAAQSGPVGVSVFVEVAAYWLLGERDVSFGATDGTQSAVFGFEKSPVAFDAGLGIRFSWRPTGK